jgi:hypothetical protein
MCCVDGIVALLHASIAPQLTIGSKASAQIPSAAEKSTI